LVLSYLFHTFLAVIAFLKIAYRNFSVPSS
jgi:hypothetical protein